MKKVSVLTIVVCLLSIVNIISGETIRGIEIDFVPIGNPGNMADINGHGTVNYNYCVGKYEVTNAQWTSFVVLAGKPRGHDDGYEENSFYTNPQQPVGNISWYEALQFCNYLTSGDKSKGVYRFSGNNQNPAYFLGISRLAAEATYGTIYYLPTEDEWYKAAFYKPDGTGYSIYANGLDTISAADIGWNYDEGIYAGAWDVGTGEQEQNGTYDMMGNIFEWNENFVGESARRVRGGSYQSVKYGLDSDSRGYSYPGVEMTYFGFRIASNIPEPSSLLLLGMGWLLIKCNKTKGSY